MEFEVLPLAVDTFMYDTLAVYVDVEGAKNSHVLQVLLWGFEGCWRFLTGALHLDIDLDMVTGL